jgi:uncharacterized protein
MLSVTEGRVLGSLMEKERTVPDQYPLTMNALLTACNQSTAREPVMHLEEHEVAEAITSMKAAGLARLVHPSHGRSATRYRQVADEAWGLHPPGAAIMALLLLRGPQTVAELRARAERLHLFESLRQVEDVLEHLSADGFVEQLERQAGQKETRWRQVVADEADRPMGFAAATESSSTRAGGAERIAELERQVADLNERLARVESLLTDLL